MNADQLLALRLAQRTVRCEVEPGKVLLIRRPLDHQLRALAGGLTAELLAQHVVGWQGITEADLLGAAVGAEDEAEFSPALLSDVLGERGEWASKGAHALVEAITQYLQQREATAKN